MGIDCVSVTTPNISLGFECNRLITTVDKEKSSKHNPVPISQPSYPQF